MSRGAALAVLVLLAPMPSHAAETLGRLFFTPEQRAQLDTLRIRKVVSAQTKDEPPPEFVTYNGIIRRTDGKTTVWVNNKALSETELRDQPAIGGRISRDGQILLGVSQTGAAGQLQLKVGQSAELLSGRVNEPFSAPPATSVAKPQPKPGTESNPPDSSAAKPVPATRRSAAKPGGDEPVSPADREAILLRERAGDAAAK